MKKFFVDLFIILLVAAHVYAAIDTFEGQAVDTNSTIEGVNTTDTIEGQALSTGGGGPTYLHNWTMENSAADSAAGGNWTGTTEAIYSNTAPAPLVGSYSGQVTQIQDAGAEYWQSPSISGQSTLHVRFDYYHVNAVNAYGTDIIAWYDTGDNFLASCRMNPDLTITAWNGTQSTQSGASAWATGTDYNFWGRYTKGTGADGITQCYISTTTKPGSPTVAETGGDATADTTYVRLSAIYDGGNNGTELFDNFLSSATEITN